MDGLNMKLMAKVMTEIIKKIKNVEPKKSEKENKLFNCVAKQNPKTYDGNTVY